MLCLQVDFPVGSKVPHVVGKLPSRTAAASILKDIATFTYGSMVVVNKRHPHSSQDKLGTCWVCHRGLKDASCIGPSCKARLMRVLEAAYERQQLSLEQYKELVASLQQRPKDFERMVEQKYEVLRQAIIEEAEAAKACRQADSEHLDDWSEGEESDDDDDDEACDLEGFIIDDDDDEDDASDDDVEEEEEEEDGSGSDPSDGSSGSGSGFTTDDDDLRPDTSLVLPAGQRRRAATRLRAE